MRKASTKRLRLADSQGWHSVIVEYASARDLAAATVAMRLRDPNVGVAIVHAERIEHCEPATSQ